LLSFFLFSGQEVFLATLTTNDYVGETSLLTNTKINANVTARTDCVLLKLEGVNFQLFLKSAPEVAAIFEQRVTVRTSDRLKKIPFFTAVKENKPWSKLDILASLFVFENFDKGEIICREGEEGNKFYVVVTGSCEAKIRRSADESKRAKEIAAMFAEGTKEKAKKATEHHDKEQKFLNQLNQENASPTAEASEYILDIISPEAKACWFGEISLLKNTPRMATITAITDVTCLSITRELWQRFTQCAPELKESVESLLTQRTATMLKSMNLFKHVIENKPFSKMDIIGGLFQYEALQENTVIWYTNYSCYTATSNSTSHRNSYINFPLFIFWCSGNLMTRALASIS
jgi:CRP-like cAMP-binding protein